MFNICRFVVVAAVASEVGCAHRPPMVVNPVAASCHRVVPDRAREVTWVAPGDARDLGRISEWCRTVGPVLVESPEAGWPATAVESLPVVTWNVRVGGGDIEDVVGRLRRGEFTKGRPTPHFVLLLQEAYREGSDLPHVSAGSPVPRAIVEHPPAGVRRDIRSLARSERLHVLYAPAMRNGMTSVAEDRGTAILSTLPLANLQVIELPFERQRRVALAATVVGATPSGADWQLRLAAVHLDTSLALTRGGPVVARRRQAEALVEALDRLPAATGSGPTSDPMPMVVGGDFNTWLGHKEPALEVLRRAFPDMPRAANASTWRGPLGARASLDHVFVRGRFRSVTTRRLPGRFGSDHYPLLTMVVF
jgi:endonuclease/exonuclease/phosphatase family metal-dependent hydrolase